MLTLKQLRDNREDTLRRLQKKGVDAEAIIARIEELDEALLPFGGGEPGYSLSFNYAQNAATVNLS